MYDEQQRRPAGLHGNRSDRMSALFAVFVNAIFDQDKVWILEGKCGGPKVEAVVALLIRPILRFVPLEPHS
jgi:hypothetical protein